MLNERWTTSIPDELPDDAFEDATHDEVIEINRLHSALKMHVATGRARRKEAMDQYGVVLDPNNELRARLSLITDMFVGVLSPERLQLEIQWQKLLADSTEEGIAYAQEMERERKGTRHLHIPGKGKHAVKPEREN